jgi:hypothetical protein
LSDGDQGNVGSNRQCRAESGGPLSCDLAKSLLRQAENSLVVALTQSDEPRVLIPIVQTSAAVAERLNAAGAPDLAKSLLHQAEESLVAALTESDDPDTLITIVEASNDVSEKSKASGAPELARSLSQQKAKSLVAALAHTTDVDALSRLRKSLITIAERLDNNCVQYLVKRVIATIEETSNANAASSLMDELDAHIDLVSSSQLPAFLKSPLCIAEFRLSVQLPGRFPGLEFARFLAADFLAAGPCVWP